MKSTNTMCRDALPLPWIGWRMWLGECWEESQAMLEPGSSDGFILKGLGLIGRSLDELPVIKFREFRLGNHVFPQIVDFLIVKVQVA